MKLYILSVSCMCIGLRTNTKGGEYKYDIWLYIIIGEKGNPFELMDVTFCVCFKMIITKKLFTVIHASYPCLVKESYVNCNIEFSFHFFKKLIYNEIGLNWIYIDIVLFFTWVSTRSTLWHEGWLSSNPLNRFLIALPINSGNGGSAFELEVTRISKMLIFNLETKTKGARL